MPRASHKARRRFPRRFLAAGESSTFFFIRAIYGAKLVETQGKCINYKGDIRLSAWAGRVIDGAIAARATPAALQRREVQVMPAPQRNSLIDEVDEADRPIGAVERGQVFAEAANFRVVHIFVFDDDGSLLLQKLSPKRERHPGRWGSSVAGYLHAGETYWEAARRRLREELGLTVPLKKHGATWMVDEGCRKFINLYLASSNSAEIREPDHVSLLRYWSLDELRSRLGTQPAEFTETFRHLFRFLLATSNLPR